jgi:para-nitrobenzyl esterase
MYGPKAEEFLQLWPAQNDEEAKAQAESVGRSTGFGASTRQWIEANAATAKSPSWLYIFSKAHTYAPGVVIAGLNQATAGAYHMSDTPFWLDTMDTYNMFRTTRAWTAADLSLAKKMSDVLVAFARTGDPSTPAVKMPKYNARDEQIVEFGDTIKVVNLNTKGLDFIANTPAAGGRGGRGEGGPY